jgi:hypothetical protein
MGTRRRGRNRQPMRNGTRSQRASKLPLLRPPNPRPAPLPVAKPSARPHPASQAGSRICEAGAPRLVLCAFDLIELDGKDLRWARFEDRKRKLANLGTDDSIAFNKRFEGDGATIFEHACAAARASCRNASARYIAPVASITGSKSRFPHVHGIMCSTPSSWPIQGGHNRNSLIRSVSDHRAHQPALREG